MQRFQKVLVAVDVTAGDDFSHEAGPPPDVQTCLQVAQWVHEQGGGRVTIMSVIADPGEAERQELLDLARGKLEEGVLPAIEGVPDVELVVDAGTPHVRLIQHVLREDFDLVIVGARKTSLFQRTIVGSVAMQLLRKCPCPVLVAPRHPPGGEMILLSAVGLHDLTPAILELSAVIVKARGGRQWHVFHCPEYPLEGGMRLRGVSNEEIEDYEAGERDEAWQRLHELCDPLAETAGVPAKLWMAEGLADEQIALAARQLDARLIVMGTIGRSGLAGMLIGNTADKVFAAAECPVLAIKPEGFVSPITLED